MSSERRLIVKNKFSGSHMNLSPATVSEPPTSSNKTGSSRSQSEEKSRLVAIVECTG
jgi:hypothetical protein